MRTEGAPSRNEGQGALARALAWPSKGAGCEGWQRQLCHVVGNVGRRQARWGREVAPMPTVKSVDSTSAAPLVAAKAAAKEAALSP